MHFVIPRSGSRWNKLAKAVVDLLERRTLMSDTGNVETDLPRYLTDDEKQYLEAHPELNASTRVPTAPPTGPVDPVAEYDQMEGLVVSWVATTAQASILAQIGRRVTVEANSRYYVGVTSSAVQTSATTSLTNAGANLANVTFFTVSLNSIWARDYGPRYVYEGDVRVITDHKYNRPTRTADDAEPAAFAALKKQQIYEIGTAGTTLVHGGGNYHLASDGEAFATQLINNENPSFTTAQIQGIWSTFQNNNTTIVTPFPTSVDATQHIDMWMQIYGDKKAFISDWPSNVGSTQDVICDNTAALLVSRGYEVTRLPAYSIGGTHYTYANMVLCNNVVLLPQYNNGPGSTVSNTVFSQVQAAFAPLGKTVYQINADSLVTLAGVFHCIVQHVPRHRGDAGLNGGLAPTAYLRGPNTGGTFSGGQQINLQWITDDDAPVAASGGVTGVDILLSTNGGRSFDTTLATNQPALGSFNWTVPVGIETSDAVIRVMARDGVNNTGFDDTNLPFTIDSVAPSLQSGLFAYETEQRLDVQFSETASLGAVTLTNLDTGQILSGAQLSITGSGSSRSVRPASGVLADGDWRFSAPAGALTDSVGNASTVAGTTDFFVLAGDADRDRDVDIDDFGVLAARFNQPGTFSQADFNYSGTTDIDDFGLLAARFNQSLPAAGVNARGSVRLSFGMKSSDDLWRIDDEDRLSSLIA